MQKVTQIISTALHWAKTLLKVIHRRRVNPLDSASFSGYSDILTPKSLPEVDISVSGYPVIGHTPIYDNNTLMGWGIWNPPSVRAML